MLSAKPWKLEAVLRLVFSVFLCFCAGYLISVAIPVLSSGRPLLKILALDVVGLACLATALILIRTPWGAGDSARRLVGVLVCTYAGMILGLWAQNIAGHTKTTFSTGQMLVALASFQGALLVFIPGFLREHQTRPVEAFGLASRLPVALVAGVLAGSLFFQVSGLIQAATG